MKTAIYSRKSVYRESGESLENQVALCRQYLCMQYGEAEAAAAEVFEDEGVSAKNLARAELQRMLRAVRAGEIGRIVCYRLDRISRNVCDFTALLEGLERRGVEIVCIREKFDTSTPMGKAMLYIASVFAQLERETISERVRDTMLWMARGGRWLGGQPPYGYAAVRLHWPEGTGREKYASFLREEPAESRVVRRIFREYLRFGEIGAVRASLCRAGVWSRTGKAFSAQAIRAILQNPAYCRADAACYAYFGARGATVCFLPKRMQAQGILAYNKRDYRHARGRRLPEAEWIVAESRHPALISGREWVQAQEMLQKGRPPVGRRRVEALCVGRLYCALCGARLLVKRRGGSGKFDYICARKLRFGAASCAVANLAGQRADAAVCRELARLAAELWAGADAKERQEGLAEAAGEALQPEAGADLATHAAEADAEGGWVNRLPAEAKRQLVQAAVRRMQWDGETLEVFLQ